jgi:hypothetical protein
MENDKNDMVVVKQWRPFLETYSQELLACQEVQSSMPSDVINTGWMGYSEASEEEILTHEERLGIKLPGSYRSFLQTTNGWRCAGYFSDAVFPFELLPIAKVEWFHDHYQDWIDIWNKDWKPVRDEEYYVYGEKQDSVSLRTEYLATALLISTVNDAGVYLLNPMVVFDNHEWEAWHFSNWFPGAMRFPSFASLIAKERERYILLRKEKSG